MAQTNTISRAVFAKLAPHDLLLANLKPTDPAARASRTNGRGPDEARRPRVNTGSLSHTHGSAIVRNGDTTVICGVRGELLPVSHIPHYRPRARLERDGDGDAAADAAELRDYDLLVPNIELATGCAPPFLPGVPPTPLAQTLSTRVYSLLHGAALVDVDELRVWYTRRPRDGDERMGGNEAEHEAGGDGDGDDAPQVMAYWTLYIDLLFISFDGNPFDAAWAAVLAALRDTTLPRAWWDADRGMVLCSRTEKKPLSVRGLPVASTALVLLEKEGGDGGAGGGKHWVLVDPDRGEEELCRESVTVVVDRSSGGTRVRGISKGGGVVVGPKLLRQFVGIAERRWDEFREAIEAKPDVDVHMAKT